LGGISYVVRNMIAEESATERMAVTVQGQLVPLPQWLVEGVSERIILKGVALVETFHGITNFHVVNKNIVARTKGSSGDNYLTKVSIWDKEKDERPVLLTCNCPHGVFSTGICYHKVALILKVLMLPSMPSSRPLPKYEDDFDID